MADDGGISGDINADARQRTWSTQTSDFSAGAFTAGRCATGGTAMNGHPFVPVRQSNSIWPTQTKPGAPRTDGLRVKAFSEALQTTPHVVITEVTGLCWPKMHLIKAARENDH